MKILLTGGAGYIGSHAAVALLEAGHSVVCFDNYANSKPDIAVQLEQITGSQPVLIEGDIRDRAALDALFSAHKIDAVIHFAGLKAVGESVARPLDYYENNVWGTACLLQAMTAAGVRQLVFSSSATVYGSPQYLPLDEAHPRSATNPYGRTKLIVEEMLEDLAASDPSWRIAILRYFNPVGAHASGLIGEDPNGIPNNLMPFVTRVASGKLAQLSVFGNDYDTPDGTGVRDYIHVVDLVEGHLAALTRIASEEQPLSIWNLGTGTGYSVLDLVCTFEAVNDVTVPFTIAPRRAGDVAACYAAPDRARAELGWQAQRDLGEMCRSAWQFEALAAKRNS
ncbi:UDP-glucose 4-epimerase GalE [Novosphingobium sp.]|uniref:UDP-glucose 4-epimerase GalE n=1 Tax=Novosphingobium sp. TaxID=1874826 RepID=UPI0026038655|nr:UDP-glucose 4-epimerase GalE [Novosphingobium sp.]